MQNKSTSTGYVPVTIELPPDLAAQFHKTNYNWEAFVRLVAVENSPCSIFDLMLDLYFDYTLLLSRTPEEITPPVGDAAAQLQASNACHSADGASNDP